MHAIWNIRTDDGERVANFSVQFEREKLTNLTDVEEVFVLRLKCDFKFWPLKVWELLKPVLAFNSPKFIYWPPIINLAKRNPLRHNNDGPTVIKIRRKWNDGEETKVNKLNATLSQVYKHGEWESGPFCASSHFFRSVFKVRCLRKVNFAGPLREGERASVNFYYLSGIKENWVWMALPAERNLTPDWGTERTKAGQREEKWAVQKTHWEKSLVGKFKMPDIFQLFRNYQKSRKRQNLNMQLAKLSEDRISLSVLLAFVGR